MDKLNLLEYVDKISDITRNLSDDLWNNPEISEQEKNSANLFRNILKNNDFIIKEIDGMENAFIGEYGSGYPVIAVLGEYDALPGLSQKIGTEYSPIKEGGAGHGCGHNLLGSASLGAVLAIKKYIDHSGVKGTIRFYACPEEETLCGKVKMIKKGAFDNCDVALSWHPFNANVSFKNSFLANNSIKFKFFGKSSHAGATPHLGRSALDAVELMNVGANYLREHVIDQARIHYTITQAGTAPNIVPAEAESWYFVRAPRRKDVEEITERLIKIANGAAMMTETRVEVSYVSGCYELLQNDVLYELTYKNMKKIGVPSYTDEEKQFAKELQDTLNLNDVKVEMNKLGLEDEVGEIFIHDRVVDEKYLSQLTMTGSSDSGDVSWIMPMNFFITSCWPMGVSAHSWQSTASSGSDIGKRGMEYASKIMAGMMYDMLNDTTIVEKAKQELKQRTKDSKYISPLMM